MTDKPDKPDATAGRPATPTRSGPGVVDRTRQVLAQVVWVLCSVAALFLALGALFIAFKANTDNALVKFVLDAADSLDLGVFDRNDGVKRWTAENAQTKNALFNWGLGALVWLIAGRVLDRVIRPGEAPTSR